MEALDERTSVLIATPEPGTTTPSGRRMVAGVVIAFLIHGIVVSTWVSRISAVKRSLQLGHAEFGMALLASAIGSLIAIPLSGLAVDRYGARRAVLATACLFAASLVPLAVAPGAITLALALFLYGAAAGANDVAINAEAVAVEKQLGDHWMSRFHAMFSLGGMAGASLGAIFASAGIAPPIHFAAALVVVLIALLGARRLLPDLRQPAAATSGANWRVPSPAVLVLSAIGFCIFLSEGAVADWITIFLAEGLHADEGTAAVGYGVFSASMTVFRLVGDLLTKRLGRAGVIRGGGLIAACGLAVVCTSTGPLTALAGFAAAGAGLSSIIPIVFGAAGRVRSVSEAAGIATVSGTGYLGFLVGPPLIGFVSGYASLRAGLFVLVMLTALAASLVGLVRRVEPGEDPLQ